MGDARTCQMWGGRRASRTALWGLAMGSCTEEFR